MRNARFGFFTPDTYLGKSGIFAAYASHGLVPITVDENDKTNEDQLQINNHFLTCGSLPRNTDGVSTIGEQVHDWYTKHRLAVQVEKYAEMLIEDCAK